MGVLQKPVCPSKFVCTVRKGLRFCVLPVICRRSLLVFKKKGGGTTDAIHIISEKAGTAVAGSRILALERQKKFENSTKRREFSRGLFCPVERILRSLVCYLESYACHDLAIILFLMLLVSCAQNRGGGGLLLSSETSRDECRAAQTYF